MTSSPLSPPRLRFAPSPTGPLHIGGVRTALYAYLYARQKQGAFILRVEDTDRRRVVPGSEDYLHETLAWLGITPDEGPRHGGAHRPYRQSERKAIYQRYVQELLDKGAAYYAFDTPEALEQMRRSYQATGRKGQGYNALIRMQMENSLSLPQEEVARRLAQGAPCVVRLRVDPHAQLRFHDEVRSWMEVKASTLDDKVLMKADGMPTYHLAHVVDDHLMQITHVIRGEEWLPSTPLHLLLYQAFGWSPPAFVHLPLILKGKGKGKLSKRATQMGDLPVLPLRWRDPYTGRVFPGFREAGYLPEALVNFLAFLGWHPGGEQELFDRQGLIEAFSLTGIHKAGVRFDEAKARWFNQQHLKRYSDQKLVGLFFLSQVEGHGHACTHDRARAIVKLVRDRVVFPEDLWKEAAFFFEPPLPTEPLCPPQAAFVQGYQEAVLDLEEWAVEQLELLFKEQLKKQSAPARVVVPALRKALTGASSGPELAGLVFLMGKYEVYDRLKEALAVPSAQ